MEALQQQNFELYKKTFIQRKPKYGVKKAMGKGWSTRNYALHDNELKKHLAGDQHVACIGSWYPSFCTWDFDNVPLQEVYDFKDQLHLKDSQVIICCSESLNSYHLHTTPEYNGQPITIRKMNIYTQPCARTYNIEVYPQARKLFRLPFGKGQQSIDELGKLNQSWEQQLFWFNKLDPFDISTLEGHQMPLAFRPEDNFENKIPQTLFDASDAQDLFDNGLQGFSTRDRAQFTLIKHLWRANCLQSDTAAILWAWIRKKHNGFSKDFLNHPQQVQKHIQHQTKQYYDYMERGKILPDKTQTRSEGYICKSDLLNIVDLAQGSLPRIRFGFNLVKYMNPRQYRDWVCVHSDKFMEWTSRASSKFRSGKYYMKHLNYMESKGVLERGTGYRTGEKSKSLKLNWNYQKESDGIFYGGRAVQNLEKAVSTIFKPEEFRGILRNYVEKSTARKATKTLFQGGKKGNDKEYIL
jgi:hypothetical protein